MARITSPEPGFTGDVGGVHFVQGIAETDDPAVIGYCQGAGYDVERTTTPLPLDTPVVAVKPPARSATKADWVAYALTTGADRATAEGLTRDQLAEQYGGTADGQD